MSDAIKVRLLKNSEASSCCACMLPLHVEIVNHAWDPAELDLW